MASKADQKREAINVLSNKMEEKISGFSQERLLSLTLSFTKALASRMTTKEIEDWAKQLNDF